MKICIEMLPEIYLNNAWVNIGEHPLSECQYWQGAWEPIPFSNHIHCTNIAVCVRERLKNLYTLKHVWGKRDIDKGERDRNRKENKKCSSMVNNIPLQIVSESWHEQRERDTEESERQRESDR